MKSKLGWSYRITAILTYLVTVLLLLAVFYIPSLCRALLYPSGEIDIYTPMCVCLYVSLLPAFAAMFCLHGILCKIRDGAVFVTANVKFLKILSFCSLAECIIYFILGFFKPFSFVIAFAALFLFVALMLLKDVFKKAVELREDNDNVI